jgi:hypothetical protein
MARASDNASSLRKTSEAIDNRYNHRPSLYLERPRMDDLKKNIIH